jgi:diguanylate cyclase (GGDEF)-like protein
VIRPTAVNQKVNNMRTPNAVRRVRPDRARSGFEDAPPAESDTQHFGGWYTRSLLGYLDDTLGGEGVRAVLADAGEERPVAVLADDAAWSSYAQFRALLEAAGRALGGPDALVAAGARIEDLSEINRADAIRTLETVDGLYATTPAAVGSVCPILRSEVARIADREWLISLRLADGFEPFAELCRLECGIHEIGARIFGFTGIVVTEEQCMRLGAAACVYRVTWDQVEESARRDSVFQTQVRALEGQLEEFQRSVASLVSGEDLQTVLTRTFAAASRAVRSPVCMLALNGVPPSVQRIYAKGVAGAEADVLASELLGDDPEDAGRRLVVDVISPRQLYGRLAVVRPSAGFLPHERPRLQAYAGFVAAAVDSAWALHQARRQGETARALLRLSSALATISSVEEIAATLVRAVPDVMGCKRAAVLLPELDGIHCRVAASHGFAPALDTALRERTFPIPQRTSSAEFRDRARVPPGSLELDVMTEFGTTARVLIPIFVDGNWAAMIVASVAGDQDPLRGDQDNGERVRGLAAQAATAIKNAQLLDQVRHQAFHDALTGLPNRALILDRAEQALARARRLSLPAAAMFIDLDGFKEINDTFGHAAGDELLRKVTGRLTSVLRSTDTVGRLGGDEFVVLIDGASMTEGAVPVASRLLAVLREPFDIAERGAGMLFVTASIGIAIGVHTSADELLREADIALYRAKGAGKNRYCVFSA